MAESRIVASSHAAGTGSRKSYTIGFIYSVVLTAIAFGLVAGQLFSNTVTAVVILVLALLQLLVQLIFFLHLGRESGQKWNVIVFVFMLNIVVILVVGSLWIMYNLNYNHEHRTPSQVNESIIHDEGYK